MKINVTDRWNVVFDGNQYIPEEYKEPTMIPNGKYQGQMSKGGWKEHQKYYPRLDSALNYIITKEVSEMEELSLKEFLVEYERVTKVVTECLNK